MRTMLEAEGHSVIEAESGRAGLAHLVERPDAIFVDVDMPHMTGVQFLIQLRQHPERAQTPATFVTGHGERIEIFADAGIAEPRILSKPFHRRDLCSALARMLTGVKRHNLKVALSPNVLRADVDGEPAGAVLRLGQDEIALQPVRALKEGRKYRLRLGDVELDTLCTDASNAFTRLRISSNQRESIDKLQSFLAIGADALVGWARPGAAERGYLKHIDSQTASVVSEPRPALNQPVILQLPWKGKNDKGTSELRGCSAIVTQITDDGFSCAFDSPSTEFRIALTALLSDGTVLAGEGAPLVSG